ncbi:glycosyltransferase family 2 protein [Vaginisenegalia massiliensis]|uniref:glycosyltransferase family 2 protein n=1 Tax=Vaginisenegalia massiliensis TaxID=2058294 RepID=UPI0013DDDEFD|nr:glycosyltransferase family 2 protein [Vaginisenegalia massiliensis]
MANRTISVVIPIYNVEKYLPRCLDSVVNQSYRDLQIILVNDGSSDQSLAIAQAYADKDERIELISQENQGLSAARNTGMRLVKGDYLAFVDSDDWLELDAFSYLLDAMDRYQVDMVVAGLQRKSSTSQATEQAPIQEQVFNQEDYMRRYFKIGSQTTEYYAWNKLYKTDLVKDITYPVGLTSEDVLATFEMVLKAQNILVSNKVIYNYFRNDAGITGAFSAKDFDLLTIWDRVVELAQAKGNSDYVAYAKLNRYRIDMTLLTRIAVADGWRENRVTYAKLIKQMVNDLRIHKKILLQADIPFTRKIFIRAFVWNYFLVAQVLNIFRSKLQFIRG